MDLHAAFAAALEAGDVAAIRRLHGAVMPHLPAPKSDLEAEISMHIARTASESVSLKARAWSHAWLRERQLPSQLPDRLRASAERLYPRVVEAVGISVNFGSKALRGAVPLVRGAMEAAVEDCFANGDRDPRVVSARMAEAKQRELTALFGGVLAPKG